MANGRFLDEIDSLSTEETASPLDAATLIDTAALIDQINKILHGDKETDGVFQLFLNALSEGAIEKDAPKKALSESISIKCMIFNRLWDQLRPADEILFKTEKELDNFFHQINVEQIITEIGTNEISSTLIKERKIDLFNLIITLYHELARIRFHLQQLSEADLPHTAQLAFVNQEQSSAQEET